MLSQPIDAIQSSLELISHPDPVYASSIKLLSNVQIFCIIFPLSLMMCVLFETEHPFPLLLSLALFSGIVIWGLWKVKLSHYSLLTRAMIVLYALPFIHCFSYLWNREILYSGHIWGLKANPYQVNLEIIKRMTMVGCIGAFGLVAGYLFAKMANKKKPCMVVKANRSLTLPAFLFVAIISLFISWINAPKETILTVAYTMSKNQLNGINFNAGWVVSDIFAVLLLIDTLKEKRIKNRRLKIGITLFVFLTIVLWFQFLRGDRECIGMIVAFIVIYFLNNASKFKINKKKLIILIGLAGMIFILGQIIGSVRSEWSNAEKIEIEHVDLTSGTWSAVLLTPLSVVGDFYYGLMKPRWGRTYWDYFLSLPPGILMQLLDIKRPVEPTEGPAWEMRYGLGGTHAMVVPFMNFKSFGVFFVLLLYGFFLGKLELGMRFSNGVKMELLYGSIFVIAPFWFWYGEMVCIRGLMAFYIVWSTYRLLPKL